MNRNKLRDKWFISEMLINPFSKEPPCQQELISHSKYIYNPYIPRGVVSCLHVDTNGLLESDRESLIEIALSVASGIPFKNKHSVPKKGYVFLGTTESYDDIHRCLRKASNKLTDDQKITASKYLAVESFHGRHVSFMNRDEEISTFFQYLFQALIDKEPDDGWSLIIFYPLSRFMCYPTLNNQFIVLAEQIIMSLKGNPTLIFGSDIPENKCPFASFDWH